MKIVIKYSKRFNSRSAHPWQLYYGLHSGLNCQQVTESISSRNRENMICNLLIYGSRNDIFLTKLQLLFVSV